MKYHNYTWNTGHCMHHDTAVNLSPAILPKVRELLAVRAGPVPGLAPVAYRLDRQGSTMAALTTYGHAHAPIWTTLFFVDAEAAIAVYDVAEATTPAAKSPTLPDLLTPPGLLTIMHPTVALAGIDLATIQILADFAKTMFSVWALDALLEPSACTT
ncbi:MAG: hypothetical protein WC992_07610 [Acholeplasmataceae bacterium]|jgi:hypothetical protein